MRHSGTVFLLFLVLHWWRGGAEVAGTGAVEPEDETILALEQWLQENGVRMEGLHIAHVNRGVVSQGHELEGSSQSDRRQRGVVTTRVFEVRRSARGSSAGSVNVGRRVKW